MSAAITRRIAAGVAAATATALVLAACDAEDTTEPESQVPAPAEETEQTPEPPDPRTITFTEPVDTEIDCDCFAQVIGGDGQGYMAIAEDLPIPAMTPGQDDGETPDTTLFVINGDGETVWSDDSLTWADGSVGEFFDAKAHATGNAIIARADESTLVGLDWSDGSALWTIPDVAFSIDPELVPERDEVFVLSGMAWDSDGDTFHPRVSVVDAADASVRWDGREVRDYDVSPDGEFLLTAEYGDDGTALTRVDLADGATAEATVDSWQGRGQSLTVHDDGRISAFLGPSGDNERMAVEVDWDGGPTVTDVDAARDGPGVPGLPEADEVDTHEESGLVLARTPAEGEPETVVMVDADGEQLWERPASDVLRWRESQRSDDAPEGAAERFFVSGADFVTLPDGEPVLLVNRTRPAFSESEYFGSVEGDGDAAFSAINARTGDELWSWGDKTRTASFEALDPEGVFFVAQGGMPQTSPTDEAEPAPLTVAVLDLRTGDPDWQVDGPETSMATLNAQGDLIVVQLDGGLPWLISAQTELADG